MTIEIKDLALRNGFDYFCPTCMTFFSVSTLDNPEGGHVSYCPCCGIDGLIKNSQKLAEWCKAEDIDPAALRGVAP
jgi:hypothetical protein